MTKNALITGCSKRIGKSIALMLHQSGYNIAIHYHNSTAEAKALCKKFNDSRVNSAKIFQADLSQSADCHSLINNVLSWQTDWHVLINSASIFIDDQQAQARWQEIFDLNLKAPYILSNGLHASLKNNLGCIINITDTHAATTLEDYHIYCMTKAALNNQTRNLARAFSPKIRVNAIAPGAILKPNAAEDDASSKKHIDTVLQHTPLKKFGGNQAITSAITLCIENAFMTGVILPIDGGCSLL